MGVRAQGLPMSTLVVIILVVLVLVSVGLIFFSGTTSGQAGLTSGASKAESGAAKLGSTDTPFKGCTGTSSKTCGDFCSGAKCGTATNVGSCSLIGCTETCYQKHKRLGSSDATRDSDCGATTYDKCVGSAGGYANKPDCTRIYIQSNCGLATGCTWS